MEEGTGNTEESDGSQAPSGPQQQSLVQKSQFREGETKSREGRNLPKAQGLLETGLGVAPDPGEDGGSQGHGLGFVFSNIIWTLE